ncbi:hypothetical protein R8Z57_03595 [Microbacterium sp. M3]|uniref:Multidrug transporter n=1 Tax=Microbacterium arthrosphaerae TaxID=792652 RepID=A0ABU4GXP8_9MICO|nr:MULTISPECIES: hypothetical protein [Microbacterium]MDW4571857.1 hypothetical protein [Microbacterium arthrosphaerae]MDW7605712.1 hypothetical protein [Microbacterium sp. M3]
MDHDRSSDQSLPEGVINADPAGGWEGVDDQEARERNAQTTESELLTDAALQPDDPVEGEAARRGADPDMAADTGRGEEP